MRNRAGSYRGDFQTIVRVVVLRPLRSSDAGRSARRLLQCRGHSTLTRTIPRVAPDPQRPDPEDRPKSPLLARPAEKPAENPNKLSGPEHRIGAFPRSGGRFRGWEAPSRPPHGVFHLLCGFAVTVSYRDLFGFCGIFCWCYVNHAIFSTLHEFL